MDAVVNRYRLSLLYRPGTWRATAQKRRKRCAGLRPVDVELPSLRYRVVQPDILVVLNHNLGSIGFTKIVGVPDQVVEILSPGAAGYDRPLKRDATRIPACPSIGWRTRLPRPSRCRR